MGFDFITLVFISLNPTCTVDNQIKAEILWFLIEGSFPCVVIETFYDYTRKKPPWTTLIDMTIQLSSLQLFGFLSFGLKFYINLDISRYGQGQPENFRTNTI